VAAVDRPRFVGGHPMAGSEQVGVEGASAELFVGATWVLTPTPSTDPAAYARVRTVLAEFGANVVALDPAEHDSLVAVVSHVPHLTAAALMALASDLGEEHGALLQLAAGGFRDMTRIAAGQPTIWPGICDDNAGAIVETLDLLVDALGEMRRRVAERDHASLLDVLERAATARRAMGERAPLPEELVEVRIPVLDRPGAFAEIAVLATELGINIYDVEIAHSVEGERGVLVVVIAASAAATFADALAAKGHRSSTSPIGSVR
jgi:prephenate dehydrogenase